MYLYLSFRYELPYLLPAILFTTNTPYSLWADWNGRLSSHSGEDAYEIRDLDPIIVRFSTQTHLFLFGMAQPLPPPPPLLLSLSPPTTERSLLQMELSEHPMPPFETQTNTKMEDFSAWVKERQGGRRGW